MTTYRISNTSSGHIFGIYEGASEIDAIAAMQRDAGYAVRVECGELVWPKSAPESVIEGVEELEAEECAVSIEVSHAIGCGDIGDATGADESWQETVRAACEAEIESELASRYPAAEIAVTVEVRSESGLTVETDHPSLREYDAIKAAVLEASERGFNRACSGR